MIRPSTHHRHDDRPARRPAWHAAASLALALALGFCLAAASSADAQDVPFDGVVVQDGVPVRAGAGNAYYEVGQLEGGTSVRVEEVLYGWNRIRPPEGVYSFVSKMNVDARDDGRVGEVNTDRVSVTAASPAGPSQSYRRQVVLSQGDRVRIVGEEGSYYKIEPPDGAPVYLPPGSVRHLDEQPRGERSGATDRSRASDAGESVDVSVDPVARLAQSLARDPAEAEGADEASDSPDTDADAGQAEAMASAESAAGDAEARDADADAGAESQADAEAQAQALAQADAEAEPDPDQARERMAALDAAELEAIETPAVSEEVREVELRNLPFFLQPLEDQPIARMMGEYRQLERRAAALPAADRRLVRVRLAELERNERLAQTLTRIGEVRQRVEQRAAEQARAELAMDAAPRHRLEDYDVIGKLRASSVYDGRTLPRMFRLIDPSSGRTIAYIKADEPVQPHRMLGRLVGVTGSREYNQSMGLYVLNVRQIDVLELAAGP